MNSGTYYMILSRWTTVLFSLVIFQILNFLIHYNLTPESARQSRNGVIRWRNNCVSCVHSFVTGIWALVCFYNDPSLKPGEEHNVWAIYVTCVTQGYFIYDTIDNIRFIKEKKSYDILLHHTVILFMFSLALFYVQYTTFVVLSLMVEVNGVFLHIRLLLKMAGVSRDSLIFRVNSVINLGTFLVFRIFLFLYMWYKRRVMLDFYNMSIPLYYISLLAMATLTVINIILCYRLIKSDFLSRGKNKSK